MKPEEKIYQIALDWKAGKVASGQFLGLIRMEVESALISRTDQCAKILKDDAGRIDRLAPLDLSPTKEDVIKILGRLEGEIRALNQPSLTEEKKS